MQKYSANMVEPTNVSTMSIEQTEQTDPKSKLKKIASKVSGNLKKFYRNVKMSSSSSIRLRKTRSR